MNKPKFNLGDKVWFIENGKAIKQMVVALGYVEKDINYRIRNEVSDTCSVGLYTTENQIFRTKEELIDSL